MTRTSPSRARTSAHRRRLAAGGVGLALLLGACAGPADDTAADGVDVTDGTDGRDDAATPEQTPTDDASPAAGDAADQPDDGASDATPGGTAAADCSAQGAEVTPVAADLPAEVAALRDLLLDAAQRCDEQALRTAIEESEMFTYSFGGGDDAIGYWRELEEAGEQPYLRLAQVLGTTPAVADGGDVVVWPRVTTGRAEDTTDEAWDELTWMSQDELAASRGEAGYLGWRVGISMDGEWRFFVAGD